MLALYRILFYVGHVLLRIVSPLHGRLKLFLKDRAQHPFSWTSTSKSVIWIHTASLGEFEQVRPLIEEIRHHYPQFFLLLTFFSPSGYHVRKHYKQVDSVQYLPLDYMRSMYHFFRVVRPIAGIIVKYDFWPLMARCAYQEGVPLISIGTRLLPSQLYFRTYGAFFRNTLKCFTAFLVQDVRSSQLLRRISCYEVEVVGDLRYDGVASAKKLEANFEVIDQFKDSSKLLVVWGSLWPNEWPSCSKAMQAFEQLQHIIVPHQITETFLQRIERSLDGQVQRFSSYTPQKNTNYLLLDKVGMLSRLYRWGDLAYVGGGKRGALHNILEPTAYGLPVVCWAHCANEKFPELKELEALQVAYAIKNYRQLHEILLKWSTQPALREVASQHAATFTSSKRGACQKIFNYLKKHFLESSPQYASRTTKI